jgi:hypothetical protein
VKKTNRPERTVGLFNLLPIIIELEQLLFGASERLQFLIPIDYHFHVAAVGIFNPLYYHNAMAAGRKRIIRTCRVIPDIPLIQDAGLADAERRN